MSSQFSTLAITPRNFSRLLSIIDIILSYLKPYNSVQTNGYYQIEIVVWNHLRKR